MAVPKRKISKARRDKRRNSHRMCKACGYYNGREVVAVKEA